MPSLIIAPDCSCFCKSWCVAKRYLPLDGTHQWSATGHQQNNAVAHDVALSSEPAWYVVTGDLLKVSDTDGSRTWQVSTPNVHAPLERVAFSVDRVFAGAKELRTGAIDLTNLWTFDPDDGAIIASRATGTNIYDMQPDGSGGVWVAHDTGITRYDLDLNPLTTIGCGGPVLSIAVNGSDIYALTTCPGECLTRSFDGGVLGSESNVDWTPNIIKFTSSGTVTKQMRRFDSSIGEEPRSIAYYNGTIFVGSNVDKIAAYNATTFACLWEKALSPLQTGDTTVPGATGIVDLAASDDGVYAVLQKNLFLLNGSTGAKIWSRRNEGTESSVTTSKRFFAVAADNTRVVAVGGAVPCNSTEVNDGTVSAISPCNCDVGACCEAQCGNIQGQQAGRGRGPFGGFYIGNCLCNEVPCGLDQPGAGTGCFTFLNSTTIEWWKDNTNDLRWIGRSPWTCSTPQSYLILEAAYSCASDTWDVSASVNGYDFGAFTLSNQWCEGDNPSGQPENAWFNGYFTITDAMVAARPDIFGCCGGTGGTVGTEVPGTISTTCCAELLPEALNVSLTGCGSTSFTINWNGSVWTADFTTGSCTMRFSLSCTTGTWSMTIRFVSGSGCGLCEGSLSPVTGTCSPFSLSGSTGATGGGCTLGGGCVWNFDITA